MLRRNKLRRVHIRKPHSHSHCIRQWAHQRRYYCRRSLESNRLSNHSRRNRMHRRERNRCPRSHHSKKSLLRRHILHRRNHRRKVVPGLRSRKRMRSRRSPLHRWSSFQLCPKRWNPTRLHRCRFRSVRGRHRRSKQNLHHRFHSFHHNRRRHMLFRHIRGSKELRNLRRPSLIPHN